MSAGLFTLAGKQPPYICMGGYGVKITAERKGIKSEAAEVEALINSIKATAQEYRRIYLWSDKYKAEIEAMDFEAVVEEYKAEIKALAHRI